MSRHASATVLLLTLAILGGCASVHGKSGRIEAARAVIENAASRGDYQGVALSDLDAARGNLSQAETAQKQGRPRRDVDNLAYAAEQLAMAAMARRESAMLQDRTAREREAQMALHRAETAEQEAARARDLAQPSQ